MLPTGDECQRIFVQNSDDGSVKLCRIRMTGVWPIMSNGVCNTNPDIPCSDLKPPDSSAWVWWRLIGRPPREECDNQKEMCMHTSNDFSALKRPLSKSTAWHLCR